MEKKALKTRYFLPPNVNGRCRGRLSLCLDEIKWQSKEPFQFNSIQAKIIWWGDKIGHTLKLKNKKHLKESIGHAIHYSVATKLTLFRSYLVSSESIDIKFTSGTSNIDIGRASVPIPGELINFIDQLSTHKVHQKCFIYNVHNKMIGELSIAYDLMLYDRVLTEAEMANDLLAKENAENAAWMGNENDMNHYNLELDLDTFRTTSKRYKRKPISKPPQKMLPKWETKCVSSATNESSPLLSYLTGRPLAELEEKAAVKSMESTSPTESLIDLLTYNLHGLYLPKKTTDAEIDVLKKIDCLRIQVNHLNLTRAGVREILSKNSNESSFSSGTFTVNIELHSVLSMKIPSEKNAIFNSKVVQIFSSAIDNNPPSIDFSQSSVHKLNSLCIKSRSSYANGIISLPIHYRDIESSELRHLGTARILLFNVIQAKNLAFHQQCPVTTTANEIATGRLSVSVELGCRGLHFGMDFLEAISTNPTDESARSDYSYLSPLIVDSHRNYAYDTHYRFNECASYDDEIDDLFYNTHAFDSHDEQSEDKPDNSSIPVNIQASANNSHRINGNSLENIPSNETNRDLSQGLCDTDKRSGDANELQGLFYVGEINYCSWYQSTQQTFLVCRPFWTDSAMVTENCETGSKEDNFQLNYLELFSVIYDQKLFESIKHGFMSIEVWQRGNNQADMVGTAKVPLHQFFIAFNNNNIRNHVNQQELPVISIDGWVTLTQTVAPSNTPLGTVQVILAVGTAKQINSFNKLKCLASCKSFLRLPQNLYPLGGNVPCTHESNRELVDKNSLLSLNNRNSNLAAMFSSFIDTLAARLPERHLDAMAETTSTNNVTTRTSLNQNITNVPTSKHMRPTSELLDQLQKALSVAPSPEQKPTVPNTVTLSPDQNEQMNESECDSSSVAQMFKVHIEIENALHLPSISVHLNRKTGKRNRNLQSLAKKTGSTTERQPNTYVSFDAAPSATATNLTSYSTNIVENSCSPRWNKHFEVFLPVDFLKNNEKRFEIRVWRKINNNALQTRLIPNSSIDVTIGFATVDLSVLLAGLPVISGWFNIIDHAGCINGQIKIHIKPMEDVMAHHKRSKQMMSVTAVDQSTFVNGKMKLPSEVLPCAGPNIDNSALSRALKRKFTELEEISQRLRARLFDVTGNMSIDPDDEFESDLNTIPDEDDNFEESNIASEMSLDWLQHCQNQAPSTQHSSTAQTSISSQIQDILQFLSPDNASPAAIQTGESIPIDIFNNRFNAVLNEEIACADAKNDPENSVQNIADTLKKSIIDD